MNLKKKEKTTVGAGASARPTSRARQNNGITLIALVITIIVMLILVAVTISMAVNGGLFEYAGKAVGETQNAINKEQELGSGEVSVEDTDYSSIDEYLELADASKWLGDIGTGFESGEGTEKNPYKISTANQLAYLAQDVNNGNTYEGKYIVLTTVINLNNLEWTPIGNATTQFKGIFDGNGYAIYNLKIDALIERNIGLFGYTSNGEIKNLTLHNANVKGFVNVGTIVGNVGSSKMTNLTVTGLVKVEATQGAGGMLGRYASNKLTDLTVDVDTGSYVKTTNKNEGYESVKDYVGGIIGFLESGESTVVTNAKSNIDVIGNSYGVGGITGLVHSGNQLINCSYSGNITLEQCAVGSIFTIGGIAGVWYNGSGTTVTLTNCNFTGQLSSIDINGNAVVEFENDGLVGCAYTTTETGELIIN